MVDQALDRMSRGFGFYVSPFCFLLHDFLKSCASVSMSVKMRVMICTWSMWDLIIDFKRTKAYVCQEKNGDRCFNTTKAFVKKNNL